MSGKSVSEQINKLVGKRLLHGSGAGDFDIEDSERAVFTHADGDNSSDASDDGDLDSDREDALQSAHYVQTGKSRLREAAGQDTLAASDDKYTGKIGSRDQLYRTENSDNNNSSDEDESDAMSFKSDSEDELIEEEEEEDDDDDDENDEEEENEEEQRAKLSKLVKQETKLAINKLSQSTKNDANKGYSILKQTKLFENIIDVRIKLQKCLNSINSLPLTQDSWNILLNDDNSKQSKKTQKLLNKNEELLSNIFNQLTGFRKEFQMGDNISKAVGNSSEDGKTEDDEGRKRSFDELTKETESLDQELKLYRNAVLNKWSTKISTASGNTALNSSKFKAINQPADIQVENQLSDMNRLMKRTKLNRRNITPFNFKADLKAGRLELIQTGGENEDDVGEDDEENIDIPKNYDPRKKDNNAIDTSENPYIFDDEDFYRLLLNDLLDKKLNDSNNGTSSEITMTRSSNNNSNGNKMKKNIDTKASKGRKLNYSIQEPIANFEAPVNQGYIWSDEQIDEFFAGLLGQKINFNEDESEGDDEQEDTESGNDIEAIKNDDIQIFG